MEFMPSVEKQPEQPEKKAPTLKELILKSFKDFRDRPDKPKYSYEEQNKFQQESMRGDKEAAQKFIESKKDKYHISAINAPLVMAELFLESKESKQMPKPEKRLLQERIKKAYGDLEESRVKKQITKEQVEEVLNIMDAIQPYLEEN
jgi:hypothetical protein